MVSETLEGGCHCGAVRFRVRVGTREVVDCNCSICKKKGFLHLFVEPSDFELVRGEDQLTSYRFNTRQANHLFCKHCGIHPYYIARSHPNHVDVNARCLDDVDLATFHVEPFDGENWEANVESIRR